MVDHNMLRACTVKFEGKISLDNSIDGNRSHFPFQSTRARRVMSYHLIYVTWVHTKEYVFRFVYFSPFLKSYRFFGGAHLNPNYLK